MTITRKHWQKPPPRLRYCLPAGRALLQRPMLAMVGSRSATPPGKQIAEDFARQLSAHGYTIVSGLASGIDAAAHRGALQETGSTIAVIGTGIDRVYPASNRKLAHQIGRSGLILSEFPLGAGPVAGHFRAATASLRACRAAAWWWKPISIPAR
jgi:DNA processing protein